MMTGRLPDRALEERTGGMDRQSWFAANRYECVNCIHAERVVQITCWVLLKPEGSPPWCKSSCTMLHATAAAAIRDIAVAARRIGMPSPWAATST